MKKTQPVADDKGKEHLFTKVCVGTGIHPFIIQSTFGISHLEY